MSGKGTDHERLLAAWDALPAPRTGQPDVKAIHKLARKMLKAAKESGLDAADCCSAMMVSLTRAGLCQNQVLAARLTCAMQLGADTVARMIPGVTLQEATPGVPRVATTKGEN